MPLSIEEKDKTTKRVAIMQPYVFPYLGYFNLIIASDFFVFYDDVNFIKRGWINRNHLAINGSAKLFTIPALDASLHKKINRTSLQITAPWKSKFLRSLEHNYKGCAHYSEIVNLVESLLPCGIHSASTFAGKTIIEICKYLGINRDFNYSSIFSPESEGLGRVQRLAEITKKAGTCHYINSAGGKLLYESDEFEKFGVKISFVEHKETPYPQDNTPFFIPRLSIIDVLMNNNIEETILLFKQYSLNQP
ncbi:MAG: WbqC family protein [Halomonadaceae bacterium]